MRSKHFPSKEPQSENKLHDELLANQLSCSEKDRAEHLMIVDLMRNDLGKICQYGSVKVEDLFKIHSFPTVHHMISRVYGELRQNTTEMDIFRATFPGGSITGAPKESAMKIIDELEEYSRGIYTGSLGYITSGGDMDFNIAIRTMTVRNGKGIYPVGGGIVWDSDPEKEWDEAIQKSKILSMNQE
ncbi:MAG: chorismate-binding protein [Fidelibacterota bacterium]